VFFARSYAVQTQNKRFLTNCSPRSAIAARIPTAAAGERRCQEARLLQAKKNDFLRRVPEIIHRRTREFPAAGLSGRAAAQQFIVKFATIAPGIPPG
jgi:hypothetical protein